jgi:hypothetical protein
MPPMRARHLAVATVIACLCAAAPAAAGAAIGCHGQGATSLFLRQGVSEVKVQAIGCRRAVRVLRRWATDGYPGDGPAGWRCRSRPLNDQADRVRCSRGGKRMRFDVGGG